jgi:two-component system, response regulator PdtaR
MKILLVDDEIILQNLFKFHLKNLGFEDVMVAQTGEQAIALAEEHQPQIAFLDINLLTNVDGIEAGKEIKVKSPNTYIIFVSANEDSLVMERALQVDNLGFLNKPYNPELIEQYIKMVAMRIRKANRNK